MMIRLMKSAGKAAASNPVATALLAAVIFLLAQAAVLRHRAAESAIVADSLSLVALNAEAQATAAVTSGDSAQRVLVIQHALETDSLERLLGIAQARLRAVISARVDTEYVEIPVTLDSTFTIDQPPFHLTARLASGPPITLRGTFSLDSISLTVSVGCSEPTGPRQLRHAMVAVKGPPWLPLTVSRPEAEEGVCNPRLETPEASGGRSRVLELGIGAVAGATGGYLAEQSVSGAVIGGITGALIAWILSTVF